MKKKRNMMLLILTCLVVVLIITLILFCKNKERVVVCKKNGIKYTIIFRNSNIYHISGTRKLKNISKENEENFEISIIPYTNVINYNKEKQEIDFSITYDEKNKDVLNYVGFNYNNSSKYKDVIKNMEDNNYYCK